ncbi:MAG: amidohydrolase [Chloroflexi bacterium]|nr:amidohydrolase [Chloroflexota bacterium]
MTIHEQALKFIDAHSGEITAIAKSIWENPELGLKEFHASKLLAGELEKAGFSVDMGVADMPTAFVAEWGEGKPVIGILAEYDALPGLSQKISAVKDPIKVGAPGHGCGHNLFGAGSFGTVIAVKDYMEKNSVKGTLRLYGTPAEELGIGKPYMARAGLFDDLDAAITWHPMSLNMTMGNTNPGETSLLALNSFKVQFTGRAAHAAGNPQQGRSALKAIQLLDTGVQYMREHIPPQARIHSVITNGGGAPNVVPAFAEAWYFIRAPKRDMVNSIYAWIEDIIKGAALMTQTTYEIEFLSGLYELLGNKVLSLNLLENMKKVGDLKFSDEDKAFAREMIESVPPQMLQAVKQGFLTGVQPGTTAEEIGEYLNEKPLTPVWGLTGDMSGSTDVGDVSFITPTGQITATSLPLGIPLHSWQSTACSGSDIGFKSAVYAAKVMALTSLDLFTKPDLLQAAKDEFIKSTGGKKYVSPLPEGAKPH